jgi:hypothetical protein
MAIPLFEESHTGESLFKFVSKMLDALCSDWRLRLIGSSTDGAANMTGCNVGFTTRWLEMSVVSSIVCGAWLTSWISLLSWQCATSLIVVSSRL